jgi:Xaa-Pro aminopeptidase
MNVRLFSGKEMKRRLERVQALMRKDVLDALLITNEENFIYFIGNSGTMGLHQNNARPAVAVIPAEGDPICVVGAPFRTSLSHLVRDIRYYTDISGVSNALLVRALRDAGLQHGRVGIESGLEQRLGMPFGDFINLTKSFPDVAFDDAAPLIWRMRMAKSEEELAYLRQSADITGRARQKCFSEVKEGMTERQIARHFSKLIIEEGADRIGFVHLATTLPRINSLMWSERRLRKGDTLYLDGGAYVRAYCVDVARIATIGKASERQIRNHRTTREVSRKMAAMLKPGALCSDVFKGGVKAHKDAEMDLGDYPTGRLGHGEGMLFTEPPSISANDHTVLQEGMVISTEPHLENDQGVFIWEDVWVVTKDGADLISTETDELREIID